MKTVKAVFGGKELELPANNSGWISNSEVEIAKDIIDILRNAPRVGSGPKNEPIIQDDNGKKIHLGSACLRKEGESIKQGQGSGSTKVVSSTPLAFAKEALGLKGLSAEAKAYFEGVVREAQEAQKAKLDKALAAMIAAGVPEDVAKKTLGL